MRPIDAYLRELEGVQWLSSAGLNCKGAHMVKTIAEGYDSDNDVWSDHTHLLEKIAIAAIGDPAIDEVFRVVSAAIHEPLYNGVCAYFERRKKQNSMYDKMNMDAGLYLELMDSVKRDISWAAVENVLNQPGFFTGLLNWYRQGRWPCSWKGKYPSGKIIVL